MSSNTTSKRDSHISVQRIDGRDGPHTRPLSRPYGEPFNLEHVELDIVVDGKARMAGQPNNGATRRPAASRDPRDPLNLTRSRKIMACFFLCFFGAMAAAAELILGAMLPVFQLQYSGIDPKTIGTFANIQLAPGTNPLTLVSSLPNAPPVWKIYLLGSLPVLIIGVSNLLMVPLATAVGRRPVILACGIIAICGCIWAGFSQSLDSHLLARCVQAVGAGTVESLIPFVISDLTFDDQRNTWMSYVFATQGLIIVGLGFSAPYVIIELSWRWLYYVTAMGGAGFLVAVFFTMPETKYHRTRDEINGIPRDDASIRYPPRTMRYNLALVHGRLEWSKGVRTLTSALRTLFYPQILIVTLVSSTMIASTFGAGYTAAPPLIVKPWAWPFYHLTLCLVPILIASLGTVLVTGRIADAVSNWSARRRHDGRRTPEDQLLNLILPSLSGLIGTILYGVAGGDPSSHPWIMFLTGLGLMAFGFLGLNTVSTVYVLECYPEMSGSALLSIASIRYIIAFFLTFRISEWIVDFGYAKTFLIYTILIAVSTALLPPLWWYGPQWKAKFPGRRADI